jgi:hypothetical protein
MPPLAGTSQRSFPLFYKKGLTWPHHFIAHLALLMLLLLTTLDASLLLLCASLWCGASLFLHSSLLYCLPNYLFAPCCFVAPSCFVVVQCITTAQCFIAILVFCYSFAHIDTPPLPPLFLQCFGDSKLCGGNLEASKLTISFFFFLVFLP